MKKRIIIAALAALTACGIFVGCGSDQQQPTESTASVAASVAPVEDNTNPVKADTFSAGDKCSIAGFDITVNKFSYEKEIRVDEYYSDKPDDGSVFLVAKMKVKNTNSEPKLFACSYVVGDDMGATLIYDGEYIYKAEMLLVANGHLQDEKFNPLEARNGYLAFQIPQEVKKSKKSLVLQFTSGSDVVQYKIK